MCNCKSLENRTKVELSEPVFVAAANQWLPTGLSGVVVGTQPNNNSLVAFTALSKTYKMRNCYLKVLN